MDHSNPYKISGICYPEVILWGETGVRLSRFFTLPKSSYKDVSPQCRRIQFFRHPGNIGIFETNALHCSSGRSQPIVRYSIRKYTGVRFRTNFSAAESSNRVHFQKYPFRGIPWHWSALLCGSLSWECLWAKTSPLLVPSLCWRANPSPLHCKNLVFAPGKETAAKAVAGSIVRAFRRFKSQGSERWAPAATWFTA